MGKTKHKHKGEEYTAKTRKKYKDKKHFGETSGSHSRTSDNITHKKGTRRTDETNIKGKDFVKYGYPFVSPRKFWETIKKENGKAMIWNKNL